MIVGRFALARAWPAAAAAMLAVAVAPMLTVPVQSDEVFTLEAARMDWATLADHLRADVHPPLYYVLVKIWLAVFGPGLLALRSFSLLMAAAAAVLLASVSPARDESRRWSPWFFAANGIVLTMAPYGRMYALLALLCVLAWFGSRQRLCLGSFRWSVLTAGAVAAGLCTHHFFGLFLVPLALWLILIEGRTALRLAPTWAAGIAVWALLWGRAAWEQATQRPQHLAWVQPVDFVKWAETAGAHLVFAAAALPVALAALAFRRQTADARWPREARAAAVAFLAVLALPGLISIWKPVFKSRFTIIAAPFLAVALAPLGRWTGGVWPMAAMAAGAAWMWWPGSQTACTSQEAAQRLAGASASDTVIFCRLTRKPVEYYWRAGPVRRQSFPAEIDSHPGYEGRHREETLRSEARQLAASAGGRIYVVADTEAHASRILMEALEEAGFRRQPPLLECASAGRHYFNLLAVYDPPLRQTGSPSGEPPGPESPRRDPVARAYEPR